MSDRPHRRDDCQHGQTGDKPSSSPGSFLRVRAAGCHGPGARSFSLSVVALGLSGGGDDWPQQIDLARAERGGVSHQDFAAALYRGSITTSGPSAKAITKRSQSKRNADSSGYSAWAA